jgi:hypothetical protein
MSDIREGYYNLQVDKFKDRLKKIRAIIVIYNNVINANPTLSNLIGKHLATYNQISEFGNIIIKSQNDIDYYARIIGDFEAALKSGYEIINMIYPHINNILTVNKLLDLFKNSS